MRGAATSGTLQFSDQASRASVRFVAPRTSVRPGDAFDVVADVTLAAPVASIRMQLTFDPALLHFRTPEEMDYSKTADHVVRGKFSIVESSDRAVTLSGSMEGAASRVALLAAQFEALEPGTGTIELRSIALVDAAGRFVAAGAPAQQVPFVID